MPQPDFFFGGGAAGIPKYNGPIPGQNIKGQPKVYEDGGFSYIPEYDPNSPWNGVEAL